VRAKRAEREQSRLREEAMSSQEQSKTAAAKATAISDLLQQMLSSANPDALKGSEYTVRQLLDDFSADLADQLKDQAEVEAAVRATIGRAYYRLGVADKAQAQHERALTLRRRIFGEQSEPVAESLVDYTWACFEQQQYAKGEPYAHEALDIYRKRSTTSQPVISALWVLQKLLSAQGQFAEVNAVTQEALAVADKSPGVEFPELASMIHGLAEMKNGQSQHAEAESLARKAIEMHRRLRGAEHPETAWALVSLGTALRGQQKLAEAQPVLEEALKIFWKYYSPGHKSLDAAMSELEAVLKARGDAAALEALYRAVLARQRAALGNESAAAAATLSSLAVSFHSQGKPAEAEKTLREAVEMILKLPVSDLAGLPSAVQRLAEVLKAQGRAQDAERLFEEAVQVAGQRLGETNTVLGQLHREFGVFLREEGRRDAAAEQYEEALRIRRATPNDDLAQTLRDMGYLLVMAGKPGAAEPYLREALALYRKLHQQEDYWGTAWNNMILAQALAGQQQFPAAEQAYREALEAYSKTQGIGGEGYTQALHALLGLLISQDKHAEGEALLKDLLVQQRRTLGGTNATVAATLHQLADLLATRNKPDEATSRLREALEIASNLSADLPNGELLNEMAWHFVTIEKPTSKDAAIAVELAQRAVTATNRKYPGILDTLAAAYAAAGQFTNAVNVQQEAIRLLKDEEERRTYTSRLRLYESNTPYRDHGLLAQSAKALLDQGKFAEAEPIARACLAIRQKQTPDDWLTFNTQSMLGGALLGQKRYAEAEPLLLSGDEGMKQRAGQISPAGKIRLKEALQRLVELYEATNRPDRAAESKRELE
jgi:hypothetical protein